MKANDLDRARDALFSIPPNCDRGTWVKVGMSSHAAGLDFADFDAWSAQGASYNAQAAKATWRSFKTAPGGVGAGALFGMARDHGWHDGNSARKLPDVDALLNSAKQAPKRPIEPPRKPAPGNAPDEVWSRGVAADNSNPYLVQKKAAGVPLDTLRVLPAGDPLRIGGASMAGALVVPVHRADGSMSTLQFITPTGKLFLPGAKVEGWHIVGEVLPGGVVHICEGIGAAWACWQATGAASVVTFGCGRISAVTAALRERDPTARLVLVPDVGQEVKATAIAAEYGAAVAAMPEGWPNNSDVGDLMAKEGGDALLMLLEAASNQPKPEPLPLPLSVIFADDLPDTFTPPDELVEGLLTTNDGSVLYGDSNSGKTFLAIDLACAVARGVPWMGRRTEKGLVIYLAAESPSSVRGRLQAYQQHHGVKVPNFAIVQSPIDLFDGDDDTDKVIQLVHQIEQQLGVKARLIVGDTLARLSAGANENAGQDMGLIVRRFDRIRTECKAHFCLIHHSGKAAAAGARGWSGVRAAVDTELEVTAVSDARCCEITKQRDLPGKGERIGFKLESVKLGVTKWGADATSCVVVADDAPEKASKKDGKVDDYRKTFENAWWASGAEQRDGAPYLSKSALLEYLVQSMAVSEASAKQYVKPSVPGKPIHDLLNAEIIGAFEHGWKVINEVHASSMMIRRGQK